MMNGFEKWWRLITLYLLSLGSQEGIIWGQCGFFSSRWSYCNNFQRKNDWKAEPFHFQRSTLYEVDAVLPFHIESFHLLSLSLSLGSEKDILWDWHGPTITTLFTSLRFREKHCLKSMWFYLSMWLHNIHSPRKTLPEVDVVLPLDVVLITVYLLSLSLSLGSEKYIVWCGCGSTPRRCCTISTLRAPPLLNKGSFLPIHSFLPLAEINSTTALSPRTKVWGRFLVL